MFLKDKLKIDSKREYSPEGFLKVPARISRVGMQIYTAAEMGLVDRDPTEIINVYRSPEEVFSNGSMNSFALKPITNNHPPELVDTHNSKQYSVGLSGHEILKDNTYCTTVLTITDEVAIKAIESGKCELSNGYEADIEWSKGVAPDGSKYDAIQRNIRGNHIAIVERGRAGAACRVADNYTGDLNTMKKIIIDGVEYEVSEQVAQAVSKVQARCKDAEEETKKAKEKAKEAEDEAEEEKKKAKKTEDTMKAKLDESTSKILTTTQLDSKLNKRLQLISDCQKMVPGIKWEGKDETTLKSEVVTTLCPNVQIDSESETYISARYDILREQSATTSINAMDVSIQQSLQTKDSDTRTESVVARDKMIERNANLWKGAK